MKTTHLGLAVLALLVLSPMPASAGANLPSIVEKADNLVDELIANPPDLPTINFRPPEVCDPIVPPSLRQSAGLPEVWEVAAIQVPAQACLLLFDEGGICLSGSRWEEDTDRAIDCTAYVDPKRPGVCSHQDHEMGPDDPASYEYRNCVIVMREDDICIGNEREEDGNGNENYDRCKTSIQH